MKSWGLKYWKVTSVVGIGEYESFCLCCYFCFLLLLFSFLLSSSKRLSFSSLIFPTPLPPSLS